MLERAASSCINTTTRSLSRNCPRKLHSNRKLHSAFWHHGAGDLQLPSWWTIIEPIAAAVQKRDVNVGMLEFLYPPRTLALMRKISGGARVPRKDVDSTINRVSNGKARARKFSSLDSRRNDMASHILGFPNEARVDDHQFSSLMTEQPLPSYKVPEPLAMLQGTLAGPLPAHSESQAYETPWQLYLQLKPENRTQRLIVSLLNYISFSTRQTESVRSIFLLQSPALTPQRGQQSNATTYYSAILSLLHRNALPAAVSTHESAIQEGGKGYTGTNILLAHLLQREEWDMALQVYTTKMASLSEADKDWLGDDRTSVWDVVEKLPELSSLVTPFLFRAKAKLDTTYAHIRTFVTDLTVKASIAAIASGNPERVWPLLRHLQKMDILSPKVYEILLPSASNSLRETELARPGYVTRFTLLKKLWVEYRSLPDIHPSSPLMDQIIEAVLLHNLPRSHIRDRISENEVLEDYKRFLHLETLPEDISLLLMQSYASTGDVERATELVDQLRESEAPQMSAEIIAAWLMCIATGPNPLQTITEMNKFREQEHWTPDAPSYAAILEAYFCANDTDNLYKTFNILIETNVPLTPQILLPILITLSNHGHAQIITSVLELAKAQDLAITVPLFTTLVKSHSSTHNIPAAMEAAEAVTQAWRQGQIDGPVTEIWNAILKYVARYGNFKGVNEIFARMGNEGVEVDGESYRGILMGLCKNGKVEIAEKMLGQVLEEKGIVVLPEYYAVVMRGWCENGIFDKGIELFRGMESKGIEPDEACMVEFMRLLCRKALRRPLDEVSPAESKKEHDFAEELLTVFEGLQRPEAVEAAEIAMIREFGTAKKWEGVQLWVQVYEERIKGEMSTAVLEALMSAAARCERWDDIGDYWTRFLRQAEEFARVGDVELVLPAVDEVTSESLAVTKEEDSSSATENDALAHLEHETSWSGLPLDFKDHSNVTGELLETPAGTPHSEKLQLIPSRRESISTALKFYIDSLVARNESRETLKEMVDDLRSQGWELNALALNAYIRALIGKRPLENELLVDLEEEEEVEQEYMSSESAYVGATTREGDGTFPSPAVAALSRLPKLPAITPTPPPPLPSTEHIIHAFAQAEQYLSPSFPGWIRERATPIPKDKESICCEGYHFMDTTSMPRVSRLQTLSFETILDLRDILSSVEDRANTTRTPAPITFPPYLPSTSPYPLASHSPSYHTTAEDTTNYRDLFTKSHRLAPLTIRITSTVPLLWVPDNKDPGLYGDRMERRGVMGKGAGDWGYKERFVGGSVDLGGQERFADLRGWRWARE
ncbi:hypothetical protein EJ08DRAFT_702481 [Tothia fuscella]|uniref:Uncharacterized protein n=1 Tax=Tothia fuscella TaxID=1048955 RepID=A0A9P4NGV2_9PEZI|nr:hypothetical protein EJ08DRAFT_702481 [Tothia fuscella]